MRWRIFIWKHPLFRMLFRLLPPESQIKTCDSESDHASHKSITSGTNGKNPISCRGCFCQRAAATINKTTDDDGVGATSSHLRMVTMVSTCSLQFLCVFFFLCVCSVILNAALVYLDRSSARTKSEVTFGQQRVYYPKDMMAHFRF